MSRPRDESLHNLITESDISRFHRYVSHNGPTDCWEWLGYRNQWGYGSFQLGRRPRRAHRVSWVIDNKADIPEGFYIRHSCDNPLCVNPTHLHPGTPLDNMRDRDTRNRNYEGSKIECPRGHALLHPNLRERRGNNKRECLACSRATGRRTYYQKSGLVWSEDDYLRVSHEIYEGIMRGSHE